MSDIAVVRGRIAELAGAPLLSPGEQRRAQQMVGAAARAFVAGRTLLRHLLARWLDRDPRPIELCEEPDEKPRLAADRDLDFNVAHGGELVLVAIARGRRIGVDVEPITSRRPFGEIAGAALGPEAAELLALLPPEHRAARFTSWWVRIEAVCKATGAGLVFPIDDIIPPGFAVRDLAVAAGYRAAVAFSGGPARIATTDWSRP